MTINERLISNQQRLQEITKMEPAQVLSDPDTMDRFREPWFTSILRDKFCDSGSLRRGDRLSM